MSKNEKLKKLNDNNVKKVSGGTLSLEIVYEEDNERDSIQLCELKRADETMKTFLSGVGAAIRKVNDNTFEIESSETEDILTASSEAEALDIASKLINKQNIK